MVEATARIATDFADTRNDAAIRKAIGNATTVDLWQSPDMSVLSSGRRTPPELPREIFGLTWDLVKDLAEGAGAPVDYVGLGLLTVAASLIGGKRKVRPYSTSVWTEPCILWAAAVGDPSSNKSPALDAVTGPLRSMEGDHAETHKTRLMTWEANNERANAERAAWKDNVKAAVKDNLGTPSMPETAVIPDEPIRRRLMVQDATPEAVGAILAGNPSGTLHLRDELAGWLLSFDRYSPGGREFWLEAFGGRHHVIDRKGTKEPIAIPFNGVSVLGGIQPEKMAGLLLAGADDGLVARFLWAWPEPVPYRRPRAIADVSRLEDIFRRLDGLGWGCDNSGADTAIILPLDEPAASLFERWMQANREGLDDTGTLYKGFAGKLPGMVLRIALVATMLEYAAGNGAEPRSINVHTLGAVCEFIDTYAKPSALRVFGDAALPPVERNAATLGRYIVRHRLVKLNARDIRRKAALPGMRDAAPVMDAIDYLVEADWLRRAGTRSGSTPGRASADYLVNPAVHGGVNG